MPLTPVHFGLGALPGGSTSRWFSFRTFCFANVLIDLEAAYRIPLDLFPHHHWMHTFLVGTAASLILVLPVGRPFCLLVSRWFNKATAASSFGPGSFLGSIGIPTEIKTFPALVGAFIGATSHVLLDATMHDEMRPLWPWSKSNPFYGTIDVWWLHGFLIAAGIIGILLYRRSTLRR